MESHSDNIIPFHGAFAVTSATRQFDYPHEVVRDPGLSLPEKRAILAGWASDRNAVASFPALRHLPGTPYPVTFESIMDAHHQLDRMEGQDDDDPSPPPRFSRLRRPRIPLPEAA